MAEAKEKWDEVGDRWSDLGRRLKDRARIPCRYSRALRVRSSCCSDVIGSLSCKDLPGAAWPAERNRTAMCSAARIASAAMVRVGGEELAVTKQPLPTRYRLGTSCALRLASTTLVPGSAPIRWVPIWWAANMRLLGRMSVSPIAARIFPTTSLASSSACRS